MSLNNEIDCNYKETFHLSTESKENLLTIPHCNIFYRARMPEFEKNEELSEVIEKMWKRDENAAIIGQDFMIDIGQRTFTGDQLADNVDSSLITYMNEDLFNRESYKRFYDLLDNYESLVGVEEVTTHYELMEMKKFIDVICKSNPIAIAKEYLVSKGWAPDDEAEFKDWLWDIWFKLYKRGRKQKGQSNRGGDSSGFEHVFVGEIRNGSVIGFHNWIQFYRLEKMGKVDYRGYVGNKKKQDKEFMITIQFSWDEDPEDTEDGAIKAMGGTLLGTSPEFEIAMYTVAWVYAKNNNIVNVPIQIEDQEFYVIAHVYKNQFLGSCYTSYFPQENSRRR